MFPGLFPKLRGVDRWPISSATVSEVEQLSTGGRSGRKNRIRFTYVAGGNYESEAFVIDDNSSLYSIASGDRFDLQYNPKKPNEYHCEEAESLSQTIRQVIFFVMAAFVICIFLAVFLGVSDSVANVASRPLDEITANTRKLVQPEMFIVG